MILMFSILLPCLVLCADLHYSDQNLFTTIPNTALIYTMFIFLFLVCKLYNKAISLLSLAEFYYENLPMQYTEFFSEAKVETLIGKILIFLLFLLKS